MKCSFCNTENDDGAIYCSECGKRIDGRVVCPSCGKLTRAGKFCNVCGNPLDGRKKCPRCGEVYDGDACPKCGPVSSGIAMDEEASRGLAGAFEGLNAQTSGGTPYPSAGRALPEDVNQEGAAAEKPWAKTVGTWRSVFGVAAILAVVVFAFFTGMAATGSVYGVDVSDYGGDAINLYHFFYRAFANIGEAGDIFTEAELSACYTIAVLGLLISVGVFVTVIAAVCSCGSKIYRFVTRGEPLDIRRNVIVTYFVYVAFVLMFRSLLYEYQNYVGVIFKTDLNGATVAGLVVGGILTAGYLITDLALSYGSSVDRPGSSKTAAAVVCAALLVAVACLLSESVGTTYREGSYKTEYRYGYIKYALYWIYDSGSGYALEIFAQLFSMATIVLSCALAARFIISSSESRTSAAKTGMGFLVAACATVTLVLGILTARQAVGDFSYFYGFSTDLAFIITGYGLCILYYIINVAARNALKGPDTVGGHPEGGTARDAWMRVTSQTASVRDATGKGAYEASDNDAGTDPGYDFASLIGKAERGDARAQSNLGVCYEKGRGTAVDLRKAAYWYSAAADRGHAIAQYNLGACYEFGKGVEKNPGEAVGWYRKAAEQGHATAQYRLGCLYENGLGTEKAPAEAAAWFEKAALQGQVNAQCELGIIYETGAGVRKNYEEAGRWYRKAAEQGHAGAQYRYGCCCEEGHGVEKNHAEAVRWWKKAAEQGNEDAIRSLSGYTE